jgi:hypothetical protein
MLDFFLHWGILVVAGGIVAREAKVVARRAGRPLPLNLARSSERGRSFTQGRLETGAPGVYPDASIGAVRMVLRTEGSTRESPNSNRDSPELEFALSLSKHTTGRRSNRNKSSPARNQ